MIIVERKTLGFQDIVLGRCGENKVLQIRINIQGLIDKFGEGNAVLVHKRSMDSIPYLVPIERDGNEVVWTVTSGDTNFPGIGECEIRWLVDDAVAKTVIYKTIVRSSLTGESTPQPPHNWYDMMIDYLNDRTVTDVAVISLPSGSEPTIVYEDGLVTFGIPAGAQGAKGEKGDKGDKGDQGIQGEKGDKGDTGAKGDKGDKGDQGIQGEKGDTGAKGDKGDKGDQGIQGEKGDKGDQGIQGKKGDTGATGEKGDKGDKGDTGAKGDKGEKGDTGSQGAKGDKGDKGDQGDQGIQGETGNGIASVEKTGTSGGVDTYTIAMTDGSTATFTVTNGEDIGARAEIEQLKNALTAVEIVDTASGAIASFADGSDSFPVRGLKVDLEPIQDLHGHNNPWPEGGGKNLFPPYTNQTNNGVTLTSDNGVITLNGTATEDTYFDIYVSIPVANGTNIYLYAFNPVASVARTTIFIITTAGNPQVNMDTVNANTTDTTAADRTITRVRLRTPSGETFNNFKLSPYLQIGGTSPTTWTPYSNICPISGRTAVTVMRTGKNLCLIKTMRTSHNGIDYTVTTEGIRVHGTATNQSYSWSSGINTYGATWLKVPAGTYTFSVTDMFGTSQIDGYVAFMGFDIDGTSISGPVLYSGNRSITRTYTKPVGLYYGIYVKPGLTVDTVVKIQAELDSTATAYEPYTAQTVTIQLGHTVYGGTLDVTQGVLTVDRAMVDFGDLTWYYNSSLNGAPAFYVIGLNEFKYSADAITIICSTYKSVTETELYNGASLTGIIALNFQHSLQIRDNRYSDATTFKQALSGQKIVYELATPQTYQLTPEEVNTVLGQNNVWSDADSVSVDYVADTKLYIEQLTEPDADMIADMNITSGRYFMVGNSLYLATANIANGAAISVGVNCTRTNLAEALNAINS